MSLLKSLRKRSAERFASSIDFKYLKPLLRNRLTSVFYHTVTDGPSVLTRHLYRHRCVKTFRQDLEFFDKHFSIVSFEDVLNHLHKGFPLPKFPLYLSFDDGHREMVDVVAPILTRMGLPASFFLTTGLLDNVRLMESHKKSCALDRISLLDKHTKNLIEKQILTDQSWEDNKQNLNLYQMVSAMHPYKDREKINLIGRLLEIDWTVFLASKPYLTTDQVRFLIRGGFHVGSHGVDHIKFMYLSLEERHQQVTESVSYMHLFFGIDKVGFSFPNSDTRIERNWMEQICSEYPEVGIFISTGKFAKSRWPLLHRIGMEDSFQNSDIFFQCPADQRLVKAAILTLYSA